MKLFQSVKMLLLVLYYIPNFVQFFTYLQIVVTLPPPEIAIA